MRKINFKRNLKLTTMVAAISIFTVVACNSSSEKEGSEATSDSAKVVEDHGMLMPDTTLMDADTGKGDQAAPPKR